MTPPCPICEGARRFSGDEREKLALATAVLVMCIGAHAYIKYLCASHRGQLQVCLDASGRAPSIQHEGAS